MTVDDLNVWTSCDRCGTTVQAKWLIKMVDGELAFCGHHYNEYKDKLESISYEIVELDKTEEVLQDML
mgnify:CR=1 FL=1